LERTVQRECLLSSGGLREQAMQTFIPLPSFVESAKVLDRTRLGNQRNEAKIILKCLLYPSEKGWRNHPAVKMWSGFDFLKKFANITRGEGQHKGDTMKQGYIHPITKRRCSKAMLEVALKDAESDYLCKNTTMGKVAAIAVIAAYKKALGLPMSELRYQGRKIDLSTVELDEKGNPSFQMPAPELDYWNGVEQNYGNQYAYLLYEGHRRVCVERRGMGTVTALNDKEWQRCIDLISAAPKLKEIVQKLASNSGNIDELIKASRELIKMS